MDPRVLAASFAMGPSIMVRNTGLGSARKCRTRGASTDIGTVRLVAHLRTSFAAPRTAQPRRPGSDLDSHEVSRELNAPRAAETFSAQIEILKSSHHSG